MACTRRAKAFAPATASSIVEGYLDVITAHQAGFTNVVAPMGTALTAEQVQVIRRLTANLYLALDQDAAGIRAAEKGVDSILQTSAPQLVVRGRRWNGRLTWIWRCGSSSCPKAKIPMT